MPQQTINTPRDTTLQATNTALGLIAKDATIGATNTALGLLGKDASLQDIKAALLQIVSALTPSVANDYDSLNNRPQVNGVTLTGNKTAKQLGIRQTIPLTSAAYALLSSAEKMDPDKDYIITDANAVNVPIDDTTESTSKVWSSKKTDDTKADKDAILQTIEECSASTDPDDIAGAAALDMLNSKTAKYTLLWTNQNPTAAFASTTLQIDISPYDEIQIETSEVVTSGKVGSVAYSMACGLSSGVAYLYYRGFSLTNTSQIAIGAGQQTTVSNGTTTTVNAIGIPIRIFGVKIG